MEGKCAYVYFLVILTASNRVGSSSSTLPPDSTTEQPTSAKGTTTEISTFTTEGTIGTTSGTNQTDEPTTQHDHTESTTHELPPSHSTADMTSSHKPTTSLMTSLKPFVTSEQSSTIRSSKVPIVTTTHKVLKGPTHLDAGSFIGGMVIGIVLFGLSYGAYAYIQNKKRGQKRYSRVN